MFDGPTSSSPIVLSLDGRLTWVVNPRDDTVSVIRNDKHQVLKTIAVGDEPRAIAVDPDNKFAYVANAAGSSLSIIKIDNATFGGFKAAVTKTVTTGAEPWNVVISPDGKRVFVANSGQDTITVVDTATNASIGRVDVRNSVCNVGDRNRHFQPRGMAITADSRQLYVTRFLSFTRTNGRQALDSGKEGVVCRVSIDTASTKIADYRAVEATPLGASRTGFKIDSTGDGVPDETLAFPNQMQSIVIRGSRAYLPNIAASPQGPVQFANSTQAFVNIVDGVGTGNLTDFGALNLNVGARDPEPGKTKLFFANAWAIAFTNQSGDGNAYAVSSGSDLLVKLNVDAAGNLSFTGDADTTRYIDLNDPANPETSGLNAGKNPLGLAITRNGKVAYVANFVSGNVSKVDLTTDTVVDVIQTASRPTPGSDAEINLTGAEMFFSSRGNFVGPASVALHDRLSSEGWQNCASCHFDGWSDGVIWSFPSGPRKSVNLAGTFNPRNRQQQKILNYSGIFDEVEDFELNIRNVSGPGAVATPGPCANPNTATSTFDPNHGLMIADTGNKNRPPCVIVPLAKRNVGRREMTVNPAGSSSQIKALTALKEWVQNAVRVPTPPLTDAQVAGGVPAADIAAGRALYAAQRCATCHNGGIWSRALKNFPSPPPTSAIACERDLGAAAPVGSACTTANVTGNPVGVQFLPAFLKDIDSFNLGVAGKGNGIGKNVGAPEKAAPNIVAGVSQPPQDALGIDYNGDGKGAGYVPPALLGAFATPPYYHNGACETLACVVSDVDHRTAKGTIPDVLGDLADRKKLVRFLESIGTQTQPF
ncbi:beta-propeller fold lactonase family protein [Oharaeibacter diazotrophicus]|uniref:beta-propeller fold lactonase family protein n=1 Tax=Oharaeibacter diazotrophicus TaxID=1920512 RepID=UPI0013F68B96|nr:beta-propeller fold lactonase family protein [Oharaeibacter diazotrophicus]